MSGFPGRKISSYSALDGLYRVMETIGSGGFSKVKLGVHVLTGDEVAIKVMDKNFLADDIPRVRMEIDAMKNLVHQNICRLYQVIETEDKFFMILEYCTGGELFDYIVDNVRLIENEARRFFRQILSAVAFVHDQGFVHRDLKPENFLLDGEENLKLIDFGLCTQQKMEMDEVDICCGSPAYAAPELIEGRQGVGSEADMWSMGVLLYTLLCGCLPFEGDDTSFLYKKIQAGKYDVPDFMSDESAALIEKLLQIDSNHRATIEDLTEDTWVTKDSNESLSFRTQWERDFLDDDCVSLLSAHHGKSTDEMRQLLLEWNYDYLTATYLLLLSRKKKGKPLHLGSHSLESLKKNQFENLKTEWLDSSCIPQHGSLITGNIELEPALPVDEVPLDTAEEKPKCGDVVSPDEKNCQNTQACNTSHVHLDSTNSPDLESQNQSTSDTAHGDGDGEKGLGTEDQFSPSFPVAGASKVICDQLSVDIKGCYNRCTGCQGPGTPLQWNAAIRQHQTNGFSSSSEGTGCPDQLGTTKNQGECGLTEGASCKGARCWERKNGCTLLQSYNATGGHHSKHFNQHLRGKARRKSVRGHHRHIRRTTLDRLVSVWPLAKRKAMFRRSCMKYALSLELPRPPAGSSVMTAPGMPLSISQQKISPTNPVVSAFLNSIKHSSSRSSFAKNHLTRSVSHSRSFDSQLNVLTKNDHWHTPICTDLVCGSVDAELHRLHLNLETSHSKLHKKSLLSSIEHGINRLLRIMTPSQKALQGSEPQRVMDLPNIYVTNHECPQALLNRLKAALEEKSIPFKEVGYKLKSFLTDEDNKVQLSFELEVVRLRQLPAFGVQRRKLKGDPWYFKRLCGSIMTAARL